MIPGVHVHVLENACLYSPAQLDLACKIAWWLQRGKLILCEPPEGDA